MPNKSDLYREVELQSKVTTASPHQLVQILLEAGLVNLSVAQRLLHAQIRDEQRVLDREQSQTLDVCLVKTFNIVTELRQALDLNINSELPHNLDLLYDYIQRRLLHARLKKDVVAVGECASLLETLKSGWDAIGQ